MNDFNFSWKFKKYWITTVHDDWIDENHDYDRKSKIKWNYPIELCKYSSDGSRYVLAYFRKDDVGYNLESVGGRLFECISANEIGEIWKQLQAAQKMLDAYAYASNEDD